MKYILRILLAICGLAVLFNCTRQENESESNATVPEDNILRLNIVNDPPTVDPRRADDITSVTVCLMLHEGLTRIGVDRTPAPALAKSVQLSDDQRSYSFHLRKASWSDGRPITAQDFIDTWLSSLNKDFPAPRAHLLYLIQNAENYRNGAVELSEVGLQAPDPQTLLVRLKAPAPYFLSLLADPIFFPLPASAHENFSTECTSGPFQIDHWTPKRELLVRANPNFWDAGRVLLTGIRMVMIEQESTEFSMFQRGELDWHGLPFCAPLFDAVPELKTRGCLLDAPVATVRLYELNTQVPPLNNAKVRRALSLAIDRPELLRHLLASTHAPATGMLPPMLSVGTPDAFGNGDAVEAQRLWAEGIEELGLDPQTLQPLSISFNSGEDHLRVAQTIQQSWQEILGVPVQLQENEWNMHLSALATGQFMIGAINHLGHFLDPIDHLSMFRDADDARNPSNWEDPEYQKLIDAAASCPPGEERRQLLARAEARLLEAMPAIPLYFINDIYLMNPHLRDVAHSPLATVDFRWAHFESGSKWRRLED